MGNQQRHQGKFKIERIGIQWDRVMYICVMTRASIASSDDLSLDRRQAIIYRKVSNIRRTKSQNLNASRLIL